MCAAACGRGRLKSGFCLFRRPLPLRQGVPSPGDARGFWRGRVFGFGETEGRLKNYVGRFSDGL
ncbi:4Fe-4S ferredoxin [Neisseria bacilliformis ATCC BAA-1200]|uniref:4Fe-4S ferredoxin n=1 Tax=Neisseria bacilliformis ATCC BAA-1200 TaxID=888742 RepID=F2BD08_9NEIS|nr:4Fe-4S ferredoxin [Neisseria bacilliformis ATCC BAA-1200]